MYKKLFLLAAITITGASVGYWHFRPTHSIPPITSSLQASAPTRETALKKAYLDQKIPEPLATLAASVERMEEDITTLTNALEAANPAEQALLTTIIATYDDALRMKLADARPLLEKYAEKAARTHNANLFKLVTILQSCSFLFERRA